ncbi:MAG: Lpg1974 family pore-forming outer membrane protein [Pirellulales bacterium]
MRSANVWLTFSALLALGAGPAYPPQTPGPAYSLAAHTETNDAVAAARLAELEANVAALRSQLDHQAVAPASCPTCTPNCCAPRPNAWLLGAYPSGWLVGYESVVVKPFFESNEIAANLANGAYSWNYQYSPRVWLGYVGQAGLGARVRYWQFDHTSGGASRDIEQGGGDILTIATANRLRVYTIDAEVTQRAIFGRFVFNFAAGGRYAEFGSAINANFINQDDIGTALLGLSFAGGGPTLAAEAWRPLFGGLALYGNGRASLLYGNSNTVFALNDGDDAFVQQLEQATLLPIFETQLGVQWTVLFSGGSTFFVRTGVEAQLWNNVGRLPNPFNDNNGGPGFVQLSDVGNLGFFGVTAAAGLTY